MRILILEDDEKISSFVKKGLEAECFTVDVVSDGKDGYDIAHLSDYDLIVLDNILPRMTGFEICTQLRAAGKHTPIILLSVRAETDDKVRALNAGADDYLIKPFSLQELVARIRALLRRPSFVVEDILEVHGIALDTKRHLVSCNDREITLTKKEFMLLEYLMRNKGLVLSRAMIMEHVWDMNADPFSNTIESHILSLRKKLATGSTEKIILTVPGRGYKIE